MQPISITDARRKLKSGVMGVKQAAIAFLRKEGYSDSRIHKLLRDSSYRDGETEEDSQKHETDIRGLLGRRH